MAQTEESTHNVGDLHQSLGQDHPLGKRMATHSSIFAGKFHGQRSLVGYTPCGGKESDMTKLLTFHFLSLSSCLVASCFMYVM